MKSLIRYFSAPVFHNDQEKTLRAWQVNIIVNCGMFGMLVYALIELFTQPKNLLVSEAILLVIAAFFYGIGRLNHHGKITLACWLIVIIPSIGLNYTAFGTGGIRAAGYAANVIVILMVGILLGFRVAVGYSLIISALGIGLIEAESHGLMLTHIQNSPLAIWAFLNLCFFFTVGILQVAVHRFRVSLKEARRELAERRKTEHDLREAHDELTSAYDSTIEGLVSALHFRDNETEEHTRRVTELTVELAKRLNMSNDEIIQIRRGALLHDIGKIGIPDQILLKPGPLTAEERKIIEKHSAYGYEILLPILHLRAALDIPYRHHEKWDGSGYPGRLKADEIPLAARLFSVVDVWDAIRHPRIFRKTVMSPEEAEIYIRSEAGKSLDPKIVSKFLEIDLAHVG